METNPLDSLSRYLQIDTNKMIIYIYIYTQ